MKLTKVGDCLSYGLTHELINSTSHSKLDYLKSVYIYLFLNEFIGVTAIRRLKDLLDIKNRINANSRFLFEKVMTILSVELKQVVQFDKFEELVKILNNYIIPDWIYCKCDDLFSYLPELFLLDNKLYYMYKTNGIYSFRRIDVRYIKNINSDCTNDLDDEEGYTVISNHYAQIMGCNKVLGIIYLRPIYMNQMYIEYYIDSGQEVIFHEKCLGVIGDYVIIEKDNFIRAKIGQKTRVIRKINAVESYSIENEGIYVTPGFGEPIMFKPFRVGLGGEEISVSYAEARDYLWNQIDGAFSVTRNFCSLLNIEEETYGGEKRENGKFILRYLIDFFKEKDELENNKNARICYFVVRLLSKYINLDTDVLDYFYVILDASRKYEEHCWKSSLSERLYWRMVELEEEGELEHCILDLNEFRRKLLESAYWDDEKLKSKADYRCDGEKVGYFEIIKKKVSDMSIQKEKGVLVGSSIMLPGKGIKGSVSYNVETGRYLIQYSRLLTDVEIQDVVEKFDLKDRPYHIVIENKNSIAVN